ncbi:MAG: hypothetical protein IPI73_23630 [Betaproteobacteria bacterium]|nr:hypothetical protein [Betaproteobacteria bacterium]
MGNDDSRLVMCATRLTKSWWQQRAIRPFLVALVVAPLVGNPCAGPFGNLFDKRVLDIWGLNSIGEAPAPGQLKSATAWEPTAIRRTGSVGLAVDPTIRTLYAASSGGVFKSTDAGATWALSSAGITDMTKIHAVAVDPVNPAIAYAGQY